MAGIERRYSRSRGRRLTFREAIQERFATSGVGYRYLLHLAPRIDRVIIPRTNGRWSSAGRDTVGLLTTTGAKSRLERTQPVTVMRHDGALVLAASNYGRERHPSWSTNLRANPECLLTFEGQAGRYRARELEGDEREAAWENIVDFYRGYETYQERCAPRVVRVFRLEPVGPSA